MKALLENETYNIIYALYQHPADTPNKDGINRRMEGQLHVFRHRRKISEAEN